VILESDSDAYSSKDEHIYAQNDSDRGDSTHTSLTQWTDNTNCRPTVPAVLKFREGPCG
jgi:hypothetical protein